MFFVVVAVVVDTIQCQSERKSSPLTQPLMLNFYLLYEIRENCVYRQIRRPDIYVRMHVRMYVCICIPYGSCVEPL